MTQTEPVLLEEYVPGRWFKALLYSAMAITVLLSFVFVYTYALSARGDYPGWLWLIVMLIAVILGPDLIQFAILRRFGVRPVRWRFMSNRSYLFSSRNTGGQKLTRKQFVIAYGTPTLLLFLLALLYLTQIPAGALGIAFALPMFMANFWYTLLALKKPEYTLVEPFDRGVRFYETATQGMLDSRS